MYDLIVTLPTEVYGLCSVYDFSVVCPGLLVSIHSRHPFLIYINTVDICIGSPVCWKNCINATLKRHIVFVYRCLVLLLCQQDMLPVS